MVVKKKKFKTIKELKAWSVWMEKAGEIFQAENELMYNMIERIAMLEHNGVVTDNIMYGNFKKIEKRLDKLEGGKKK